jgi:hypothetical protein
MAGRYPLLIKKAGILCVPGNAGFNPIQIRTALRSPSNRRVWQSVKALFFSLPYAGTIIIPTFRE